MSTTQKDKPSAKQRQRSRKADQRNQKSGRQAVVRPDEERLEQDPASSPIVASAEAEPVEAEPVEVVSDEAVPIEAAPVAVAAVERATEGVTEVPLDVPLEAPLSGEVLPPDIRATTLTLNAGGLQTVAEAYGDYTRRSWQAGRFLIDRLIAARSFDEAIEIQGEFARQAYANFVAQSLKICGLYGELAKQFFVPLEKFTAEWTNVRR